MECYLQICIVDHLTELEAYMRLGNPNACKYTSMHVAKTQDKWSAHSLLGLVRHKATKELTSQGTMVGNSMQLMCHGK